MVENIFVAIRQTPLASTIIGAIRGTELEKQMIAQVERSKRARTEAVLNQEAHAKKKQVTL